MYTTYYVRYPRSFANEYTVYAVDDATKNDFLEAFPGAQRINRAEAIRLGISRPKQAAKHGEQWYGSFCRCGTQGTQAEILAEAVARTTEEVSERLSMLEFSSR